MEEKVVKFRLSKEMNERFPEADFEYSAHIGTGGNTTVTWVEDGEKHETDYVTTDTEEYFENGTWVKL